VKTTTEDEYRVSARVVLLPGDQFRVSGGPYWRLPGGERVPMATRGIVTFRQAIRRGSVVCLVASSKGEGTVVLHVAGRRRNRMMPCLVCRPYTVKSKVRKKSHASG
jgi:hypothetical protein